MRFVRLLPERWQKFVQEVLKFGAVGGVNLVINYAVFNALALTVFVDGQLKANVVATVVSTCTSYLMNRHWTYRDRPKSAMRRDIVLFFAFNATGLAIELGVLALAKYGLGVSGLLALNVVKTGGVAMATVFRFWSYRTFVFRVAPADADGPAHVKRPDQDLLIELDPVAELAEAASELAETAAIEQAARGTDTRLRTGLGSGSRASGANGSRLGGANGSPAGTNGSPAPGANGSPPPGANGSPAPGANGLAKPQDVDFATTVDAALATELAAELNAAELNAAKRRSPAR